MARGGGGFRPLNNGGGGGGRGNNSDRRRSRSPPENKSNNSNNNTTAGGPSAPTNTASTTTSSPAPAPAFTFEMRRLVAAAFQKFPAELAAASVVKDSVLPDVFKATDAAAFYDPAQGGTKEATLAAFQQRLTHLMKSQEISDWMMEKAVTFIDPQPKKLFVAVNNNKNR